MSKTNGTRGLSPMCHYSKEKWLSEYSAVSVPSVSL